MTARIMVDMTQVRPVFDGKWHMTRLSRMPAPGEEITMYCGETREASYHDQQSQVVVTACWDYECATRRCCFRVEVKDLRRSAVVAVG